MLSGTVPEHSFGITKTCWVARCQSTVSESLKHAEWHGARAQFRNHLHRRKQIAVVWDSKTWRDFRSCCNELISHVTLIVIDVPWELLSRQQQRQREGMAMGSAEPSVSCCLISKHVALITEQEKCSGVYPAHTHTYYNILRNTSALFGSTSSSNQLVILRSLRWHYLSSCHLARGNRGVEKTT
jgi:hypothetical protein